MTPNMAGFKVEAVENTGGRTDLIAYCLEHAPPEAVSVHLDALPRITLYCEDCGKLLYSPKAPMSVVRVEGEWHIFADPRAARAFAAEKERAGFDVELRDDVHAWQVGEAPDARQEGPTLD